MADPNHTLGTAQYEHAALDRWLRLLQTDLTALLATLAQQNVTAPLGSDQIRTEFLRMRSVSILTSLVPLARGDRPPLAAMRPWLLPPGPLHVERMAELILQVAIHVWKTEEWDSPDSHWTEEESNDSPGDSEASSCASDMDEAEDSAGENESDRAIYGSQRERSHTPSHGSPSLSGSDVEYLPTESDSSSDTDMDIDPYYEEAGSVMWPEVPALSDSASMTTTEDSSSYSQTSGESDEEEEMSEEDFHGEATIGEGGLLTPAPTPTPVPVVEAEMDSDDETQGESGNDEEMDDVTETEGSLQDNESEADGAEETEEDLEGEEDDTMGSSSSSSTYSSSKSPLDRRKVLDIDGWHRARRWRRRGRYMNASPWTNDSRASSISQVTLPVELESHATYSESEGTLLSFDQQSTATNSSLDAEGETDPDYHPGGEPTPLLPPSSNAQQAIPVAGPIYTPAYGHPTPLAGSHVPTQLPISAVRSTYTAAYGHSTPAAAGAHAHDDSSSDSDGSVSSSLLATPGHSSPRTTPPRTPAPNPAKQFLHNFLSNAHITPTRFLLALAYLLRLSPVLPIPPHPSSPGEAAQPNSWRLVILAVFTLATKYDKDANRTLGLVAEVLEAGEFEKGPEERREMREAERWVMRGLGWDLGLGLRG